MDARQARRGKRISLRQEKVTASNLDGRVTAGSGAAPRSGGADVRVMGEKRVECKITEAKTYTLFYSDLEKVRKQAIKQLEEPVLQFGFRHPGGKMVRYAVIPWQIDDKPPEPEFVNSWLTSKKSMGFTEHELESALFKGRIQFTWAMPGNNPFEQRVFEIMRWHDYVEKTSLCSK